MLRELHISNLAVIEDVTVELGPGLNCFTGQTGAGKSLVLGAFEVLLGLRSGGAADMIRPGADEARIAGLFEVHDPAAAAAVAAILDDAFAPGEQLLITRRYLASGRSSVNVNGRPATSPMVRAIGELLVDIHGQHDHQYLLKPANQLSILDAFARCTDVRGRFADAHGRLRDLVRRHDELKSSSRLRRQQLDLYEFQANEIDEARPVEGEFEELRQRNALLSNLEKVKRDAGQAQTALYDSDGSVVERLQMIVHILGGLAELDPALAAICDQVKNGTAVLQDAAFELGRYVEKVDLDPAELVEINDRLNTLNRLASKYASHLPVGDDLTAKLLAFRAELGGQIAELRGEDESSDRIEIDIAAARAEMEKAGAELSKARRAAAAKLRPLVEAQMRELGMTEAGFEVEFVPVVVTEEGAGASASGLETVEMLVRTNPGQPARPLRKIASGGEMSRIMLALKSILAQSDRISVLVFDEIDANIGGRMGTVIGDKLRRLASTPAQGEKTGTKGKRSNGGASTKTAASPAPGQQVICITHLPQIAAYADRHLRIAKSVEGKGKEKQTRTTVTLLEGDARIEELAEMLAGKSVTATTRKQVGEMLASVG
ncbi:MAG: DNA repair protein RecN [Planctomycetes bacterium]|nr:DNA repair protein RecN [Planctomycetota bacterium]